MCGRFSLNATAAEIVGFFRIRFPEDAIPTPPLLDHGDRQALEATTAAAEQAGLLPDMIARFNVAPSQQVPIARAATGPDQPSPRLDMLTWGLIPSWSKGDLKEIKRRSYRMINARSETAFEKPSFRTGISRRRCLVPTTGFYEWTKPAGWKKGDKKPAMLIHQPQQQLFAMGGIWERWRGPDGVIESFTILTTAGNDTMSGLHDRMPVVVPRSAFALWLDPDIGDADVITPLLAPPPDDLLSLSHVGTAVNDARTDDKTSWDALEPC